MSQSQNERGEINRPGTSGKPAPVSTYILTTVSGCSLQRIVYLCASFLHTWMIVWHGEIWTIFQKDDTVSFENEKTGSSKVTNYPSYITFEILDRSLPIHLWCSCYGLLTCTCKLWIDGNCFLIVILIFVHLNDFGELWLCSSVVHLFLFSYIDPPLDN